jgi:multiple sugar transport system substrate-binding protein
VRASRGRRTAWGVAAVLGLSLAAVGCTTSSSEPAPPPSSSATSSASVLTARLTFGVYGPPTVLDAFRSTVEEWNARDTGVTVRLKTWTDAASMRRAVESGAPVPDVFLTPRSNLSWLLEQRYTQPVDELLDERGIDFGDGYARDALAAFSADSRLQCMPYDVSPMVIYYNKQLVDFDRMRNRELDAPAEDAGGWSFDQFAAAADFAARPARGTKGVHIDATLPGLAPFIQSGGGSVFDSLSEPTSLAFSSDDSRAALERTLTLLRDPQLTLDERQLAQASALTWFERGKVGMIAGFRDLVPQLRLVPGLDFDVMPMPSLDGAATVGDVAGMCLSRTASSTPAAADFMVDELGADAVGKVTRTGYLAPANLEVALSDDFLQPGRRPEHAAFFNSSVRSITLAPLIDTLPELEAAVQPDLEQLVYGVGTLDLDGLTSQIDIRSRTILGPTSPTPSPSASDAG